MVLPHTLGPGCPYSLGRKRYQLALPSACIIFIIIIIIKLIQVWYSTELASVIGSLDVRGVIFNVKPIARELLVPEQTLNEIEKFWNDENKQLEIVLEEWKKTTDDQNLTEILKKLKHEGMLYFLQVNIFYIPLQQIHFLN